VEAVTLAEAMEPKPHLHERTVAVCKLTEGLALIEASKTLLWRHRFEAATNTHGITRMFARYEQILKVFVSPDSSA
jgi:hypothetical protein